jgi:N-acetylglucosaminyldiphosphoundecaprenol N-acetyl-beta-D-mannosaminyltransferase
MSEAEGHSPSVVAPQRRSATSASVWKPVQSRVMQRLEVAEKPVQPHSQTRVSLYCYLKRTMDFLLAASLLTLFSPILVAVAVLLWMRSDTGVFQRTPKTGRHCRTFSEYAFNTNRRLVRNLPVLFNILKGDLSFIGPRPAHPGEMCVHCLRDPSARVRNTVRPGLVCDWWVRRHASLDYVREVSLDVRYVERPTFRRDLGVILRALPGLVTALLLGDDPPEYAPCIRILDVRIDNISMQSAVGRVVEMLDDSGANHACFINPHYINEALREPEYKEALEDAHLVLADGFGSKLAGKILNRPLRQNLCGTDLFPRLCAALSGTGKSVYLLGAAPGVVDLVAEWINQHYPRVIIKGWGHGFFTPEEEPEVVRKIAASGADLLVVAMGVPKQEVWIHRNLEMLNVRAAMGFGGLFDYFAGRIPRAPQWVREMGMEWVYRLIQEPRRMWRRYLIGNGIFLGRVIRERLRRRA